MARLEGCHENFRLWITAEPHEAFPIGLLQACIKFSNEAPVGMKAGLRTSLQWVSQARSPPAACCPEQAEQSCNPFATLIKPRHVVCDLQDGCRTCWMR